MQHASGTLWVVATPIGNLGDLSPRAVETLRAVQAICAEDTRHTRPLLQQFGIDTPLLALHDHNEANLSERLVARLLAGESLALVSDAGTPLVSDPGYRLVAAAHEAGIAVSPVPGPCAAIAALSAAGLASDRFVFEGFLPAKSGARRSRIEALAAEPRTLIFYESAHRIREMLEDAAAGFGGDRLGCVAREVSKRFETIRRDALASLRAWVESDANQQRGEFVVLVAGADEPEDAKLEAGRSLYRKLVEHLPPSQAARVAAEISGAPRKALYGGESA
ncbi:MAG: 16S rRNA (cytidine(1402)-2'-O)-methyltransferase [Xanthomonadales bacterium]|nr:16S rRNA (cytidine(1402)-2'-O)-methyltransferase [Xanthomonadales bacterium]